jgi:hypothetical protein
VIPIVGFSNKFHFVYLPPGSPVRDSNLYKLTKLSCGVMVSHQILALKIEVRALAGKLKEMFKYEHFLFLSFFKPARLFPQHYFVQNKVDLCADIACSCRNTV